jgi:hypothetical protein
MRVFGANLALAKAGHCALGVKSVQEEDAAIA